MRIIDPDHTHFGFRLAEFASMDNSMPSGRSRTPIRAILSSLGAVAVCLVAATEARALEFIETTWGFDGKVVVDTFNPLTVVVRNNSHKRFDGNVRLEEGQGFGRSGGTYVEPCYLEPGATRMLQFYPKVSNVHNQWNLKAGKESLQLQEPTSGVPANVRLVDGTNTFLRSGMFRHFAHQRFPTTVGATDSLWLVALDYVPSFSPTQRAAFLDWLKAGGQVHLFKGNDGKYPEFDQEEFQPPEANLDDTSAHWRRAGHGRIFWHNADLTTLTEDDWNELQDEPVPTLTQSNHSDGSFDSAILPKLEGLTRLHIAWPMVYLAAIAYILLLGPGHYLWARKKTRDYRLVLIVLLGTFAAFSAIFGYIGHRGYGERTTVTSAALARHIDGNRFDVVSWGNIFVTDGDDYQVKHPSTHNLYSTGETYEAVNASMQNGRDGIIEMEIPIYSSTRYVHRGSFSGPQPPELLGTSPYPSWRWPEDFEPLEAWTRGDGDKIQDIKLSKHDGTMMAQRSTNTFDQFDNWYHGYDQYQYDSDGRLSEPNERRMMLNASKALIARDAGLRDEVRRTFKQPRDPSFIDLYIFAESPKSFHLPVETYARQTAYVVFHFRYLKSI